MDTPVIVAMIGGGVTILGFVISGVFGLLASTTERQDKVSEQRIALKDDQINNCENELHECSVKLEGAVQRADDLQRQLNQTNIDLWEARGRLHAAEVELLRIKTDGGREHHTGKDT